jgi:uncharacterized membrane protein HdeD (DUF308 family)
VGLLAMLWPGSTIAFLVALFGAYAFVDGVTNIALGVRRAAPQHERSWPGFSRASSGSRPGC